MSDIIFLIVATGVSAVITTIFNCCSLHYLRSDVEKLTDENKKLKVELESAIKIKKAILELNDCLHQKIVELQKGESDDKDSEKCDTEE